LASLPNKQFAQGWRRALVDAFSEGDKAFQKFAANFLRAIAQMILQSLILRGVQSIFLGGGGQVDRVLRRLRMVQQNWQPPGSMACYGSKRPTISRISILSLESPDPKC